MLNYISFYTHIWSDKNFKRLLSYDSAKKTKTAVIFIYMFANPSVTLSGIYAFDKEECQLKTRIPSGEFKDQFDEVINGNYNIKFDDDKEMIFVENRWKHITNKNSPQVKMGIINELKMINHRFRDDFLEKYNVDFPEFRAMIKEKNLTKDSNIEEFITNAIKIFPKRDSLKVFLMNRNIEETKIDSILAKMLPNFK